jgi:hypothetical protein
MKFLKSYKLFESNTQIFANPEDIKDILIELLDDNIISKCEFIDSGYLYFPYMWTRQIQSDLYYDMTSYPENWEFRKPDELLGQTWEELFLNPESLTFGNPDTPLNKKILDNRKEYIFLDDVKNSVSKIRQSGLTNKTKDELFIENIENGKIKAYPIMMFSIGDFDKKDLPEIVDVLKRVYQATEFRPLLGFWLEDYVDEENGDVVTLARGEVEFIKCSDESYSVLKSSMVSTDLSKVITHHFL